MVRLNRDVSEANADMFVPAKAVLKGNLTLTGSARIEGEINGNIISSAGNILLGVNSRVTGTINAKDIATCGKISGNVTASGQISMYAGSELTGDIRATAVIIEDGAFYSGTAYVEKDGGQLLSSGKG